MPKPQIIFYFWERKINCVGGAGTEAKVNPQKYIAAVYALSV